MIGMQCLTNDGYVRPSTVSSWSGGVGAACGEVVGSTEVLGGGFVSSSGDVRDLNAMLFATLAVFSSLEVQLGTFVSVFS